MLLFVAAPISINIRLRQLFVALTECSARSGGAAPSRGHQIMLIGLKTGCVRPSLRDGKHLGFWVDAGPQGVPCFLAQQKLDPGVSLEEPPTRALIDSMAQRSADRRFARRCLGRQARVVDRVRERSVPVRKG